MKVIVDWAICCNYGVCVLTLPEIFSFGDDNKLYISESIPLERQEKARFACESCPAQALRVEEDA